MKSVQACSNTFLNEVHAELISARDKFPGSGRLHGAFAKEAGEVAKALLKILESGEPPENVYKECIQAAAMACRLAVEGDPSFAYKGVLGD